MAITASPRRMLTVAETAALLSVSERTVWRRISERSLPVVQIGGRGKAVRVDAEQLEAQIAELRSGAR